MNKLLEYIKYLNRQRNLKIKPFKVAIKLALLNRKKKARSKFFLEKYHSVAILMNDQGIGDAIVTSYLIHTLRENGFSVYVVAEKRIVFLFEEFISVDGVLFYDKKKSIKQIKKQLINIKIDVVVDLVDQGDNTVRRSQIIQAIAPLHTIGFNQEKFKLYDTSIPYKQYTTHISMRSQKILELMNIQSSLIKYHINIPTNIELTVKDFANSFHKQNKKIIIFNPYGSNNARSFSHSQINMIVSFLSLYDNYVTIVVGEPNKISHIQTKKNIVINPFTSFFATVALVKFSNLVISVDTSIVHIASVYNKKMLCVYNNRIIDNKFINNFVWGPNYPNAIQIFTNDNLGTVSGDPIANFDISHLLEQLTLEIIKL
jgi:ADP-heptose:LPS heptosyltransferase